MGLAGGIIGGSLDGSLDLVRGNAAQQQVLDFAGNGSAQFIKGDLFIITAGNEQQRLIKAGKACQRTAGAAADGVVVPPDAAHLANKLDAMLHTGKLPCHLCHHCVGYLSIQRGHGGQIIFHVVHTGNADLFCRHHRLPVQAQHAVQQRRTLLGAVLTGEPAHRAGGRLCQGAGCRIVPIEHHNALRSLMAEQIALGFHILVHPPMPIQMVGGQIGDDCHGRRLAHTHQLEGRQFQHHPVGGLHLVCLIQQRCSDVAAHPDGLARCTQHFGDHRGGGGLAVRAGHCHDGTGTDLEKDLHLAGHFGTACPCLLQCRHIGTHTGGAEYHVGFYAFQILRAQHQRDAHSLQFCSQITQFLPGLFIPGGYKSTAAGQQFQQRTVAYANAHYRHALAAQGCQICL